MTSFAKRRRISCFQDSYQSLTGKGVQEEVAIAMTTIAMSSLEEGRGESEAKQKAAQIGKQIHQQKTRSPIAWWFAWQLFLWCAWPRIKKWFLSR